MMPHKPGQCAYRGARVREARIWPESWGKSRLLKLSRAAPILLFHVNPSSEKLLPVEPPSIA